MDSKIFYNGDCPICNSEMCKYAAYSDEADLPLNFQDMNKLDLSLWGIDPDDAARLLHIVHDGRVIKGFDAVVTLWEQMPKYRWAAKISRLPIVFPILDWGYANVVARYIYHRHLRRTAKGLVRTS